MKDVALHQGMQLMALSAAALLGELVMYGRERGIYKGGVGRRGGGRREGLVRGIGRGGLGGREVTVR